MWGRLLTCGGLSTRLSVRGKSPPRQRAALRRPPHDQLLSFLSPLFNHLPLLTPISPKSPCYSSNQNEHPSRLPRFRPHRRTHPPLHRRRRTRLRRSEERRVG